MTKKELGEVLAEKLGISQADAEEVIEAFTDTIINGLKRGEKMNVSGLGTFDLVRRAERTGINPQTRKEMKIPAATVPRFRAGKNLKERVNE